MTGKRTAGDAMVEQYIIDEGKQLALIAMGANLPSAAGPAATTIEIAVAQLRQELDVLAVSEFYRTPAFAPATGPDYVNAALAARWSGTPRELMALLHRHEDILGRDREGVARWAPRLVDLDLLALGDLVLPDGPTHDALRARDRMDRLIPGAADPIVPHPGLQERAFVLRPLADVAPQWRHPRLGRTVQQMLADLPRDEQDGIHLLARRTI